MEFIVINESFINLKIRLNYKNTFNKGLSMKSIIEMQYDEQFQNWISLDFKNICNIIRNAENKSSIFEQTV